MTRRTCFGDHLVKPLLRFWNEQYSVGRPLEADSWVHRLANHYVVAALMNRFPRAATRLFSMSRGELARLLFVEREGGSYRVLRAMYKYEDGPHRGDLINRVLMQSPAVKAARNRRKIAQRMIEASLAAQPGDGPKLVLAIGGGDGSLEAEVIARMAAPNVYYCGVDMDERAVADNRQVLQRHGLEGRGFVFVGNVAERSDLEAVLDGARQRFGVPWDGVHVTVCQGITEYLDLGSRGNETLGRLLTAIHSCTRPEGRLVISQTDDHDRVTYLERGLSWHMRLRSLDEVAAEVARAGWQIAVCEHEPMKLITMCLAVKSDRPHLRIDGPSHARLPRAKARVPAGPQRR